MTYKKDQLTPYVPDSAEGLLSTNQSSDKNHRDGQGQGISENVVAINKACEERKRKGGGILNRSFDEHLWLDSDDEQDAEDTITSVLADAQAYADAHRHKVNSTGDEESTVYEKLAKLQEDILGIIGSAYVLVGNDPEKDALKPSDKYQPCAGNRMTLLEIACLGNPEKTLQGEILHGLRCLGWAVVQEAGYIHGSKNIRHLDILVFDIDKISGDQSDLSNSYSYKKPLCVIEMKHLSSHQGKPEGLIKNKGKKTSFENDYLGRVKNIPIVHLGFYTTVESIKPWPLSSTGWYRFLKTYCKASYRINRNFYKTVTKWASSIKNWLVTPASSVEGPTKETFHFIEGTSSHEVQGHVEFFVGISS